MQLSPVASACSSMTQRLPGAGDHRLKGKGRILAFIVTVAAGGWLVAGCSSGTSTVPRHTVETRVATTLVVSKTPGHFTS